MGVEALCSSTFFGSNIAASAPTLSFSVAIDLLFGDAGIISRRVKQSSRARRRIFKSETKSAFSVRTSSGNSCFGRSNHGQRLESSVCRASSCEQAGSPESEDGELLGRENQISDAGKKGITLEKVLAAQDGRTQSSTVVGLNFGSSNAEAEGFQRSPLPDFEDEFFSRMMALDASPLSSSRASSTSTAAFFEGSTLNAGCEPPRPSPGQGVESPGDSKVASTATPRRREQELNSVLGKGGVQLPPSIKKLRRRKNEVKGDSSALVRSAKESGCAIKRAFSSMVYMIKAVQSHALQIRQVLFSDKWDVQQVLHLVDREMHSSFVWLFQRVFACTPTLMVSVMILLANFTVFSMSENVAIATVTETPTAIAHILSTYGNPQASSPDSKTLFTTLSPGGFSSDSTMSPLPGAGFGAGGKNNFPSAPIAEGFDGDSWLNVGFESHRRYGFSEKDSSNMTRDFASPHQFGAMGVDMTKERPISHQEMMKAWMESSMKNQVQLEQETTQRLVAPVVAHLESDKYACFDRTDLEYQHALAKDPGSAVLLANYAQFLFVVRRDNDRAEQYFHRAMEADPSDSTILGRFASFLWLGRGNRSAAERAYKAAMAAAPESSYPAGSYAHFLWHAGDDDTHGRVA